MLRRFLRPAYTVQRMLWRLLRPRTRGVKVMLFDGEGRLLLIRNGYGNQRLWVLPGGGVRPWETPERAAVREIAEELDCGVVNLRSTGTYTAVGEGKRDTVYLFEGVCVGEPKADQVEVAEASFFALDGLPEGISPATQRRIDERLGGITLNGRW